MEFPELTSLTEEVAFEGLGQVNEFAAPEEFPCIIVKDLATEQELEFFSQFCENTADALPLYTHTSGMYIPVGYIEMTLNTILAIQQIFPYEFSIAFSLEEQKPLNFRNPEFLEQLVEIKMSDSDEQQLLKTEFLTLNDRREEVE